MSIIEFTAGNADSGKSCGDFLRSRGVSRRLVTKLKRAEDGITRDGKLIRTADIIERGDVIRLRTADGKFTEPNGSLSAGIVYEDGDVIVFDKPAGMPVHPSARHRSDTLGNFFASIYPDMTFRPVNRLDKDTSGLCAVAKNAHAANVLGGNIKKTYYAVTEGAPFPRDTADPLVRWEREPSGMYVIDAPIGRAGESVVRREIRADGKKAVTRYTILKENGRHCLVKVLPETGRTHQIRVHFSSVGHPLAGDDFYGGSLEFIGAQALHCGEMRFPKVRGGDNIEISCPLREDMERLMK